jgi:flagellar L-ring protein precursor FlgH
LNRPEETDVNSKLRAAIAGICLVSAVPVADAGDKKTKMPQPTALDQYIKESLSHEDVTPAQPSAGSLWTSASRFMDLGSDLRAIHVNDLVTIVVNENATAVANGATQTSRASTLASSVTQLAGIKSPTGGLVNLANSSTTSALNGSGSTSRGATLTTTLSARVTHVLPNGYLVLEGTKDVQVNSEFQQISLRGIIRPIDLDTANTVQSTAIAQMELKINGKGVVADAIRRPNIIYRFIMGLLPF